MRFSLISLLGLLAVGCGSTSQPALAPSVATPTQSPEPYRASPSAPAQPSYQASRGGSGGASTSAAAAHPGGSIKWHERIADAQAAARSQGKLILVGSTKPDCGLCDKFAHTTAPQCWARLSLVAVPYMYDITRPEDARVDRTLRANLRGASLMPLVGFLTPDLNWVHGFWGPRSVTEFMGDIESARRIYPVHAASLPAPAPIENAPTAMLNEYGETEWSAPADWPAPEDALGPVASVGATVADPSASNPVPAAPPADPAPVATPAEPTPAEPMAAAPVAPGPAVDPASGWSDPAPSPPTGSGNVDSNIAAAPAPYVPPPSAPAPPAPVVAPPPAPVVAGGLSEAEAQTALQEAFTLIRGGQFDEARAVLKRVSKALPNTSVGREADRGAVAIYNARRVASADAAQKAPLAERARKDLDGSMWAALFT